MSPETKPAPNFGNGGELVNVKISENIHAEVVGVATRYQYLNRIKGRKQKILSYLWECAINNDLHPTPTPIPVMRNIAEKLDTPSLGILEQHLRTLKKWGLINRPNKTARTITLALGETIPIVRFIDKSTA